VARLPDAGELDFAAPAKKSRKPGRVLARSSVPSKQEQEIPVGLSAEHRESDRRIARNMKAIRAASKGKNK
jgi:hypothetical protein